TRDDQLFMRKVANDVLAQLRERHPEQEFEFDADTIRGRNQVVYLSNLNREIREAPASRDRIIKRFVETLGKTATAGLGYEVWEDVQGNIVPMLKPRDYLDPDGPTQHLLTSEWL